LTASKVMSNPNVKKSDWQFPADFLAMFGMAIVPLIVALVAGVLLTPLFRARSGDPTMLWVAVGLAIIGIVLLFIARLPLYRQRRFFTLGPGALDEPHRRIYRWAYRFIAASVLLLLLLYLTLR